MLLSYSLTYLRLLEYGLIGEGFVSLPNGTNIKKISHEEAQEALEAINSAQDAKSILDITTNSNSIWCRVCIDKCTMRLRLLRNSSLEVSCYDYWPLIQKVSDEGITLPVVRGTDPSSLDELICGCIYGRAAQQVQYRDSIDENHFRSTIVSILIFLYSNESNEDKNLVYQFWYFWNRYNTSTEEQISTLGARFISNIEDAENNCSYLRDNISFFKEFIKRYCSKVMCEQLNNTLRTNEFTQMNDSDDKPRRCSIFCCIFFFALFILFALSTNIVIFLNLISISLLKTKIISAVIGNILACVMLALTIRSIYKNNFFDCGCKIFFHSEDHDEYKNAEASRIYEDYIIQDSYATSTDSEI
jgi:hypothetical protein